MNTPTRITDRVNSAGDIEALCGYDGRYMVKITAIGITLRCRSCKRDLQYTWEYLEIKRQQVQAARTDERLEITG